MQHHPLDLKKHGLHANYRKNDLLRLEGFCYVAIAMNIALRPDWVA